MKGPIETFTSIQAMGEELMAFKASYYDGRTQSPEDFPEELEWYYWFVAFAGWKWLRHTPPAPLHHRQPIGVPSPLKPLADLDASRGFLVMVGTVSMVLDLSGFDQAAKEFLAHAHHVAPDTGQLFMLAYEFVNSVSKLDESDATTIAGN